MNELSVGTARLRLSGAHKCSLQSVATTLVVVAYDVVFRASSLSAIRTSWGRDAALIFRMTCPR
jgi:hypothetical protein